MKQPKYLVGTMAGVAWMAMFALRPMLRANPTVELGEQIENIVEWLPALETAAGSGSPVSRNCPQL